jgi:hypothetical protein
MKTRTRHRSSTARDLYPRHQAIALPELYVEAGGELISLDDCLRIASTNKQPRAFDAPVRTNAVGAICLQHSPPQYVTNPEIIL